MRSADPTLRGEAAFALGAFTYDEEVELSLLNVLRDPDEGVVIRALVALGSTDRPRVVEALAALFARAANRVRATILSGSMPCFRKTALASSGICRASSFFMPSSMAFFASSSFAMPAS